jgi:cytochrome c oxidase cbb3-type subunit 1
MQGLMWRATEADGTLTYSFVESLKATYPFYAVRLAGGAVFLSGMLVMAWNVWRTLAPMRPAAQMLPAVMPSGEAVPAASKSVAAP